jgi:acyl carrier protein
MNHFHAGLAEILEISASEVVAALDLTQQAWDSLAVVSTIALIDEHFDVMISGKQLAGCKTVSDIDSLVRESRGARVG